MNRRITIVSVAAVAVAIAACGGEQKTETGDEWLAKQEAGRNKKQGAGAKGAPAANRKRAPAASPRSAPAKAATPQPAPRPASPPPTAYRTNAPKPIGIVRSARRKVRSGQYLQGIREAKRALKRNEKYVPAMEVMARAYYHLGKTEFAESICDIALGIDPNSARCYNVKGFIALKQKDRPEALKQFKKATRADASFGPGWLNLGAQYVYVKNYADAVPALEKATSLMPNRAEVHLNLGAAYRGNNQLVKARSELQKALKIRPSFAAAYFNLGVLYLDAESFPGMTKLDKLKRAVQHLKKYRSLAVKPDEVDTYLKGADRQIRREERRIKREQRRKQREKAKKAKKTG